MAKMPPGMKTTKSKQGALSFGPPDLDAFGAKIVLYAVEGWGKTTLAAHAFNPALILSEDETGYETLYRIGDVPECDCVVTSQWMETQQAIDLAAEDHDTIVMDALGGFQEQCFLHVRNNDFKSSWQSFMHFHKGYEASKRYWKRMLSKLEDTGCHLILLAHAKTVKHQNPVGEDFDRYTADLHEKLWSLTKRHTDAVLFGNWRTQVEDGKGTGGEERVLYAEHRDAFDAKNRFNMQAEITMPDDPEATFDVVWQFVEPEKYGD
jgi:hypothetical protein